MFGFKAALVIERGAWQRNQNMKCSFTPQYSGIEALWRNYRDR